MLLAGQAGSVQLQGAGMTHNGSDTEKERWCLVPEEGSRRRASGGAARETEYYNLAPQTEGLSGRPYKASLTRKIRGMLRLAAERGFVAVTGPPMTGKTSFMQRMSEEAKAQGWGAVFEMSAVVGGEQVSVDDMIRKASKGKFDWDILWGQAPPNFSKGGVQPAESSELSAYAVQDLHLVLIDEAQLLSRDRNATFWANMKWLQQASKLHRFVRVVLFTLYSDMAFTLDMAFSSVVTFRTLQAAQQTLTVELQVGAAEEQKAAAQRQTVTADDEQTLQLALDLSEYEELWQQFLTACYYTDFFPDVALRLELYELTGGHVGLITTFMDMLDAKLRHLQRHDPANKGMGDNVLRYMFASGSVYKMMDMEGVRGLMHKLEDVEQYGPILRAVYGRGSSGCQEGDASAAWVDSKSTSSSSNNDMYALGKKGIAILHRLTYSGYLIRVTNSWGTKFFLFSSPLHYSYYLLKMYTSAYEQIQLPSPEGFEMFIKQSIARMNSSTLSSSLGRCTLDDKRAYKRHFQAEWYRAARSCLPSMYTISPDVGKVFQCNGFVDFWVQSNQQSTQQPTPQDFNTPPQGWAIELLVEGDRVDKHMQRFSAGGAYAHLPYTQHAVIDFWMKQPTTVARNDPDFYVVHFAQDFKTATFLAHGKQAERLVLTTSGF